MTITRHQDEGNEMTDEPRGDEDYGYLDRPVTLMELLHFIEPLRSVVGDLIGAMVDVTSALAINGGDAQMKEKGKEAFSRLGDVFEKIEQIDTMLSRSLQGLDPIADADEEVDKDE